MSVRIIVDSTADLPLSLKEQLDVVPLTVHFGEEEYVDGVTIGHRQFYEKLIESDVLPSTSQATPDAFDRVFRRVTEAGDSAVVITVASKLSGTYQSAMIAAADYPGKIFVVDSGSAAIGTGILAELGMRLVEQGLSAEKIAEELTCQREKICLVALLDTLEYLYRGGRLSRTSAAVGSIAGIKPIITVTEDGRVVNCGKAIGVGRAIQTMMDKLDSFELDDRFPVYSLYSCGTENCEKLEEKLAKAGYRIGERLQVGSTIGAHVGPGAYAMIFVIK